MPEKTVIDFKNDPEIISRFRQVIDCLGKRSDAAKLAGVTEDSIHKYMAGKSVPSIEVVTRLCLAAKVSIDWLMTGKVQMGDNSLFYDQSTDFSCLLNFAKEIQTGDLGYLKLKNDKILIGFIEEESKESYKVKPYCENRLDKSGEILAVKKSELVSITPTQIIKSLS